MIKKIKNKLIIIMIGILLLLLLIGTIYIITNQIIIILLTFDIDVNTFIIANLIPYMLLPISITIIFNILIFYMFVESIIEYIKLPRKKEK